MERTLNNLLIRYLTALIVVVSCCFSAPGSASAQYGADSPRGKIYMLCVWTGTSRNATKEGYYLKTDHTNDYAFKSMVTASKKYFEAKLHCIGLDEKTLKKAGLLGAYAVLDGENTSPSNIIDKIYELSQMAGSEDALFVYVLSHGASFSEVVDLGEKGDQYSPQDRLHYITPLIDAPKADLTDVVLRSNLLHYMTIKEHRLDVLITDSCSANNPLGEARLPSGSSLRFAPCAPAEPEYEPRYALKYLLTSAQGKVSWNSSCPFGRYESPVDKSAEFPTESVFKPAFLSRESSHGFGEGEPGCGTVFTRAFIQAASRKVLPGKSYSFDDFFQDLGKDYDYLYDSFRRYVYDNFEIFNKNESDAAFYREVVYGQMKTTLTAFNVDDDHTGDVEIDHNNARVKNNKIKEMYDHNGNGSSKTSEPTSSWFYASTEK